MTTGELTRLEREVEEARNRLTADIDRTPCAGHVLEL